MMQNAAPAKVAALALAIIAHAVVAFALVASEEVQVEGASGGAEVRLGNAFADMAAGTLTAARPVEPAETPNDVPDRITASRPDAATPVQPDQLAAVTPQRATAALPVAPAETVVPAQPEALSTAPDPERITGAAPETAAPDSALRPKRRSAAIEAAHQSDPVAKPSPPPKPAAAKPGNAKRDARAGLATGTETATARQSGTDGRQQAAGNADASNFPGLVMRKLSRAGKPRVNARGVAIVAFTIHANGGLASVSLARSSGSQALDQAALRLVRGASPFPKPPQGARRSFSIQIKGG